MTDEVATPRRQRGRMLGAATLVGALVVAAATTAVLVGDRAAGERASVPSSDGYGVTIVSRQDVLTSPDGYRIDPFTADDSSPTDVLGTSYLDDGRLFVQVGTPDPEAYEIRVFDEGRLVATYDAGLAFVHGTRSAVVWAGVDDRLRVMLSGASEPLILAAPPRDEKVGRLTVGGFEINAITCSGVSDCSVDVSYGADYGQLQGREGTLRLRVTSTGWEEADTTPGRDVVDVSKDGSTRLEERSDGCVVLRDVERDAVVTRECRRLPNELQLSDDGQLILSATSDALEILDRDFDVVRTIPVDDSQTVYDHAWSDTDTVLTVTMVNEVAVADPDPDAEDPSGDYQWYLTEVPIDGGEPRVIEGPVLDGHYDNSVLAWYLDEVGDF